MLRALALAVLLLLTALPVTAGLKEGVAAYNRGAYQAALREFKPLAKKGNANAQYFLGLLALKRVKMFGGDNEPIYRVAAIWIGKAAEQGHAVAQKELGDYFRVGQGVQKSLREAVKWYRKAAQQGLAAGQYNLGKMYRDGLGSPRNYREAVNWYRAAAEQGYFLAQISLSEMYNKGKGIEANYVFAYMWMSLALASEARWADFSRNWVKGRLDKIEKKMKPEDILKAQEMAAKWKPKKAKPAK